MYLRNNPTPGVLYAKVTSAADGSDVITGVSVQVSKDGGAAAAGAGTLAHVAAGVWHYTPTQAETDAVSFSVIFSATGAVTAQVNVVTTGGNPRFDRAVRAITLGTVGAGATTTSIPTSSLDPTATVTDQFKGQILCFGQNTTTAALRGQKTDITGSATDGTLTVTALTTAPASGDVFTIQ